MAANCAANWFFTFDNAHLSLGSFCPQPALTLEAFGQDFQGGRALLYAPDPSYPADQRWTVYVIYNDGEWVTFPDTWDASQPIDDPSLPVTKGLLQPIRSIGKVWRENAEVHDRLGFAYEPESKFTGRMQLYSTQPGQPQGDSHFAFLDHGKWGVVLWLNSVDMGPNKWEVAGTYTPTAQSPVAKLPTMLPIQTNNMYGIPYDSPEWLIIPSGRDDNPTRFNILVRGDDMNCRLTINTKMDFSGLTQQRNELILGSHLWVTLKTYQGNQQIDEIYYPDIYPQEYRAGGGTDGNGYAAAGFNENCQLAVQKTLSKIP
jgi:hypothetical protein